MLLEVVPVTLAAPAGKQIKTFVLLDEGSTATLIDLTTARGLGLKGSRDPFTLMGVGGLRTYDPISEVTEVKIRGVGTREYSLVMVRTVDKLSLPTQALSENDVSFVRQVSVGEGGLYESATPTVLVGQDNWELIVSLETWTAPRCGLALYRTRLGCTVHGKVRSGPRPNSSATFVQSTSDVQYQTGESCGAHDPLHEFQAFAWNLLASPTTSKVEEGLIEHEKY